MVVAQPGDQCPARGERPVDFTEHRLVFYRRIAFDGADQFVVEQQLVVEVVGVVAVVDTREALHRVTAVVQAQFLTEQIAILLAQNDFVGIGGLVEVQAGVIVRAGVGGEAGYGPVVVQAVIDLGADGVLLEFVVGLGVGRHVVVTDLAVLTHDRVVALAAFTMGVSQQHIEIVVGQDQQFAAGIGGAGRVGVVI
ncbi:hypothetical protein D3C87_1605640 [compost metagenome]